ncbi:MAG: ATP-binding protein [bacterium]
MNCLKLLIVDDDQRMRESCAMLLESLKVSLPWLEEEYSFQITETGTAEDAKHIIENEKIDILLLDQLLPGMHGTDLLEYMSGEGFDIQTVMITGNATLDIAVNAARNGASEILLKPFTPEELKVAVAKAAKFLILQRIVSKLDQERKKTRFEFIRVLSHELKSPIAAVSGYLNIIKDKTLGDNLETYLPSIERSLIRLEGMKRLIADMLDLTRIESGVKVRNIAEHQLKEIVSDMVDGVKPMILERNVTVTTEIPDFKILIDRVDLEIILTNLLTNAVKYNKDGGSINLVAHRIGRVLKIQCSDTGIGMTEEEVSKLFQEFTRIRNEQTKNILGNGLGLSILKKVVSLYSGEVSVSSKFGEGTEFTVILPGVISSN